MPTSHFPHRFSVMIWEGPRYFLHCTKLAYISNYKQIHCKNIQNVQIWGNNNITYFICYFMIISIRITILWNKNDMGHKSQNVITSVMLKTWASWVKNCPINLNSSIKFVNLWLVVTRGCMYDIKSLLYEIHNTH